MSNFSVRRLLECLASDSSLRRQFRIDREAVLVNYLLEKAERDAIEQERAGEKDDSGNGFSVEVEGDAERQADQREQRQADELGPITDDMNEEGPDNEDEPHRVDGFRGREQGLAS